MKTYAVTIEVTHTMTIIVEAKSQGAAVRKAQSEEGFSLAARYMEDFPAPRYYDGRTMRVVRTDPI